jgi:diaminopimelate decarboxylase
MLVISFHVGSGCCDAKAFSKAVAVAKTVFDVAVSVSFIMDCKYIEKYGMIFHIVQVDAGFKPTLLDIGGGFPGTDETTVTFKEVSRMIVMSEWS